MHIVSERGGSVGRYNQSDQQSIENCRCIYRLVVIGNWFLTIARAYRPIIDQFNLITY